MGLGGNTPLLSKCPLIHLASFRGESNGTERGLDGNNYKKIN